PYPNDATQNKLAPGDPSAHIVSVRMCIEALYFWDENGDVVLNPNGKALIIKHLKSDLLLDPILETTLGFVDVVNNLDNATIRKMRVQNKCGFGAGMKIENGQGTF